MAMEREDRVSARKLSKAKTVKPQQNSKEVAKSGKAAGQATTRRVRNYRRHAKSEIAKSFVAICEALVTKAKKGSIGHTRLLFDVGGVKEDANKQGKPRELSLGALLLKELEEEQKAKAAESAEAGVN